MVALIDVSLFTGGGGGSFHHAHVSHLSSLPTSGLLRLFALLLVGFPLLVDFPGFRVYLRSLSPLVALDMVNVSSVCQPSVDCLWYRNSNFNVVKSLKCFDFCG